MTAARSTYENKKLGNQKVLVTKTILGGFGCGEFGGTKIKGTILTAFSVRVYGS